jgi:DNA (cytosine-5)-methyltransferase 1
MLNHLSLFSGIGGIDLAANWAGFETVAFCEQNKFCQKVLAKHWPEVPIFDDIFKLSAVVLEQRGIRPDSIKLISGGFPCQPYSHAGKRMGNEDDRALWPEMFRVIKEVRPDWVCGENVTGIISMALDGVLSDLESAGYTCQPVVLPACAVNAPHRRERVFILAHTTGARLEGDAGTVLPGESGGPAVCRETMAHATSRENNGRERGNLAYQASSRESIYTSVDFSREDVALPTFCGLQRGGYTDSGERDNRAGLFAQSTGSGAIGTGRLVADSFSSADEQSLTQSNERGLSETLKRSGDFDAWAVEPDVGRVANGVPRRVDRLRALGNAVVPQQVYPILKAIADYEADLS